jgi:hypothetical protein
VDKVKKWAGLKTPRSESGNSKTVGKDKVNDP